MIIREFIGLRAKLYSILLEDGQEKRAAAGTNRQVAKEVLRHHLFKEVLEGTRSEVIVEQQSIRSFNHTLYTIAQKKRSLSAYDNKRVILSDGQNTRAIGHYLGDREDDLQLLLDCFDSD